MKAPPSSEKLRLLLPDPLHARRLRIILGAILVLAIAALLLLLTPARFHLIRAAVGVSLLLLLGGGVALFRFRSISFNPALRNLVARLVSPAALCFFLALLVLRLLALLALDTDRSGQEILQANWGWLALSLILALGLFFKHASALGWIAFSFRKCENRNSFSQTYWIPSRPQATCQKYRGAPSRQLITSGSRSIFAFFLPTPI